MGAKGSVEAAKLNADNWGHLEVCITDSLLHLFLHQPPSKPSPICTFFSLSLLDDLWTCRQTPAVDFTIFSCYFSTLPSFKCTSG